MSSKLKRSKACKIGEQRPTEDQKQKHEVIEISSESDCSDVETFSSSISPGYIKQNSSNNRLQTQQRVAPIFLRAKSCKKASKFARSPKRRSEVIEVNPFASQESDQSFFDQCLRDLQAANPAFPINQVFSTLQKKANLKGQNVTPKGNLKQDSYRQSSSVSVEGATTLSFSSCGVQDSPVSTPPEKSHRTNRLSRTRRLKNERGKLDDHTETEPDRQSPKASSVVYQREPFSEDVPWTDKYRPMHSSEVIGNRAAIEQLHRWLKKWKLRTDIEERTKYKETLNKEQSNDWWDCGDFEDEAGAGHRTEEQLSNTVLITGPPGVGKTASVCACAMELGFKVFEVNCSSQRNGQEVLTQLKEATQSHLMDTSGADALKPAFFTVRYSRKSDTLPVKTHRKAAGFTSKNWPMDNRSNCKKKANPITLTNYFKTKAKADYLYHSETPTQKSTKECTDPAVCMNQKQPLNKSSATCLILFEEVDVVFKNDVGFLAAIKTLMATTKRPVVLTTTDPLFRGRFNGSLDEIIFQSPSMADICSYLQLVCLAENVQLDLDDVSALFKVTRGDVRQCLLQLQFWANSGGGRPTGQRSNKSNEREFNYKGCCANMLGLRSVSQVDLLQLLHEQQMTDLLQPMVECWRTGFPLLYSNLELLLVDANEHSFAELDQIMSFCPSPKMIFSGPQQGEITCSRYSTRFAAKTKSRLSRQKTIPSLTPPSADISFSHIWTSPKALCSADKMQTTNSLGALSDFFDLMSFIDAITPLAPSQVENFVGTGAKILDGQLDEMMEEEDKSQEMILDIRATVEALGFCRCKKFNHGDVSMKREAFPTLSNTRNFSFVTGQLSPHIVYQRRYDLGKKVLSSWYFSLLHNRRAVCIDYLPVIRFICRTHRKRHKQRPEEVDRCVKSFRTQLGLGKKTVHLLASEFS